MPRRSTLRASDADREHIAERLRKAASEGRLLAEELEERIEGALTARTYGQLDELVSDLPADRTPVARSRTSIYLKRPAIVLGVIVLALAVLAAVALIITGTILAGGAWVFVAFWFFGCRGRRYYGRYARPRGWQQVRGPAHWRI
jgi:hypothetical protein